MAVPSGRLSHLVGWGCSREGALSDLADRLADYAHDHPAEPTVLGTDQLLRAGRTLERETLIVKLGSFAAPAELDSRYELTLSRFS